MTTMIQLKQVLRNKRFVLFTILIPLAWYLFIYNVQKDVVPNVLLGIAVFIGIIGNSLATFSKRISSNIGFYSFESSFSRYGLKNFLLDQTLVQVFLNALIFAVVLIFAVLYAHFPLHGSLVIQFLLLSVMGIYFSIIGFVLGVRVDAKILDTVGFPIIVLAAMTIMPFASFGADGSFINVVTKVQQFFPGYYYSHMIQAIASGTAISAKDILFFAGTFVLDLLPLYFLIPRKKVATNW